MMLLALTSIFACSLAARGFKLQSRTIQTPVCSSDFSWADNSLKESPCEVAANVDAACNQDNWIIPALNSTNANYNAPSGATATVCTCSWASYNLISACTNCQGFSITSWAAYSFYCAGFLTDTYFPANLTLPPDTLIPFWATTDPTTWTGAQFLASAAQSISNEGHPDVGNPPTSSSSSSTKSKPIGAIVGGVVGGVVVLLAAIIFGIYLIRRTSRLNTSDVTANNMSMPNMSTPTGYTSLLSTPMRPSSPTIRTHASSSIRSFPFFSSGGSTVSPSVRQQSPPPVSIHRDETAVEPFRLAPTNNYNPDRKQANGTYPVYDPPTAPPTVRIEVQSTIPTQGGRTRYNPPAYTEQTRSFPEAGENSSSRRLPPTVGQVLVHAKNGSQQSFTSGGSAPRVGGGNPARGNVVNHLTPPGTVNQMNSHGATASTSTNAITGHGRQLSGDTNSDMDRKRRRNTDDFSARDIA